MVIPYIQFYPTDYLIDTAHLALDEHGAYLLLILNYWQRGRSLPNDNKKLAGICRTDVEHWLNMRSTLLDFFDVTDTEITHKRIEIELSLVRSKSEKARKAGKASARKRTENKQNSNNRSTSIEQPFNHTDTDTDTIKTKKKVTKKKVIIQLPDWINPETWQHFVDHRKSIRSPMSEQSQKLLISKLTKLRTQGHDPDELLNTAIMSGWKSVYPEKPEKQPIGSRRNERIRRELENASNKGASNDSGNVPARLNCKETGRF